VADSTDNGDEPVESDRSPWSGHVPVTPAPFEFTWAPSGLAGGDTASESFEPPADGLVSQNEEPGSVDRRRPVLVAVAVLAGVVGIVGALTMLRSDHNSESSANADPIGAAVSATNPTVGSLPAAVGESAETDPPGDDAVDDESAAAEPDDGVTTVDATSGVPSGGGAGLGDEAVLFPDNGVWSTGLIEVPAELAQVAPMTLVAMSNRGIFHEINLPSGEVRSIGVGRGLGGAQVEVGVTTSLVAALISGSPNTLLIRAGQPPIEIDLPRNRNEIASIPSSDNYVTFSYNGDPNVVRELLIDSIGGLTIEERSIGPVRPWQNSYSPAGRVLVTDAGGVYEQQDDGSSERISDGVLISASSHHLLVRECDEEYVCDFVVINGESADRTVVQIDDALNPQLAGTSQVSPDGEFLRFLVPSSSGSNQMLVDLSSGSTVVVTDNGSYARSKSVWAAGSEGVFRTSLTSSGLEFLDRATGDVTSFAAELGTLGEFGVRLGLGLLDGVAANALATGIDDWAAGMVRPQATFPQLKAIAAAF
jgi:hypothetical protein